MVEDDKLNKGVRKFDGTKYSAWKFRVLTLLAELDIDHVITEEPPAAPLPQDWVKAQKRAKGVIVKSLDDALLGFAKPDTITAREILSRLDEVYERKSVATQLAMRKTLLELRLEGDTALVKHFTVFDEMITELLAAGAELTESDKITHLFITLPPSYSSVTTALETLSENDLNLPFVKVRLLDHEVKLKKESADTSLKTLQAKALQAGANSTEGTEKKEQDNAKQWRKFQRKKFKGKKGKKFGQFKNVTCHHCDKKGHIQKNCYKWQRECNQKNNNGNNGNHNGNSGQAQTARARGVVQVQTTDDPEYCFMAGDYPSEKVTTGKITFILDSGASHHLINRRDLTGKFITLEPPIKIQIAQKGTYILATKRGTLDVVSNTGCAGVLQDVLFCEEIPYNLISVAKMQASGLSITFDEQGVKITKGEKVIVRGNNYNKVANVEFVVNNGMVKSIAQVCNASKVNYELWHHRLGHMGKNNFVKLKNQQLVEDADQIEHVLPSDKLCEPCVMAKQTRLAYGHGKDKSYIDRPLYVVHSDVCKISPSSVTGKNYFVTFTDEFTHYCVTYLLTYKSEVFTSFKDYVAKCEALFNSKLVFLYIDNGREYLSNEMKDFCAQRGISLHLTVPHSPQLNGVAERMNRTITERARALINYSKLPKTFWGDAILTATYLINRSPTNAVIQGKTPYELWFNRKPTLKYLKGFGATVYVHNKVVKSKFDEKSWKGILVGYELNGYRIWNVEKEKHVVARDVIVDEINFLSSRPAIKDEGAHCEDSHVQRPIVFDLESRKVVNSLESDTQSGARKIMKENRQDDVGQARVKNSSSQVPDVVPRRSERLSAKPPVTYGETNFVGDYVLIAKSIVTQIPSCYADIKYLENSGDWYQAVETEHNALKANKTWTLVLRPEGVNIVKSMHIYSVKNDQSGNAVKCKVRVVAKGCSQEYLQDYTETFAPVARIASFRFLLAFANQFNLLVHHMDVQTAFLNGNLKEEIYMEVPEGFACNKNQVCKLNKALYGLKQAARCWYEMLDQALRDKGFVSSAVDPCIYILDRGDVNKNVYIVLYVDDLILITACIKLMNEIKRYLMNRFKMVDLKEIKLFLGIRVTRENDKFCLDQSSYIRTVLKKFNMEDCNPISTPLESKLDYLALNSDEHYDAPCRNLIGCIMYIMVCTRPDLCIAVNILSRYTSKNNKVLWQYLKRVLRYLKGSVDLKLTYIRGSFNDILVGYVDSDWAGDENDRKSTTGYLFKLFERSPICWNSKRQLSVAASSTEAEYMALFEAVREALWLKSLASSIKIDISKPIVIFEDNNGCISIANNPTKHKKTKHIDIKYHFSREQVDKNVIKLNYIPTDQQVADGLTKPLAATKFNQFRVEMSLV